MQRHFDIYALIVLFMVGLVISTCGIKMLMM